MIVTIKNGIEILVDDNIDKKLLSYTWVLTKSKKSHVYASVVISQKIYLLHRLIIKAKKKELVDHINGNTLDNRLLNLRIATHSENVRNRKISKNNKSGYKGVDFHKKSKINPYRAQIKVNYKKIHLGMFKTKEDAALAYNEAAIKYFGEFARLNIIKETK